jgi:hypothetical protein
VAVKKMRILKRSHQVLQTLWFLFAIPSQNPVAQKPVAQKPVAQEIVVERVSVQKKPAIQIPVTQIPVERIQRVPAEAGLPPDAVMMVV